jgi:hypothetical protein
LMFQHQQMLASYFLLKTPGKKIEALSIQSFSF